MSAVIKQAMLSFRPMVEKDLPDILAIEQSAYYFPWSRTIFHDCLRVGYCSWVLERDNIITAYGVMSVAANECHILNLCVRPEFQGIGLGKSLLTHLLEIAQKHKASTAFLEVRPSNQVAINLYNNAGFDKVGIRRNYYPAQSGREDALIMARTLL